MDEGKGLAGIAGIVGMVIGFLLGSTTGLIVGLLLAPQSGEETREYLRDKGIELKTRAEELSEEGKVRFEEAIEEGKLAAAKKKKDMTEALEAEKEAPKKKASAKKTTA
jgi:gas vesicle protein